MNLIPLFGVLFFGWSLFSIVLLYWFENGVIGFFNVLKIGWARKPVSGESRFTINGRPANSFGKAFLIPFFIFHYGLFWTVHGSSCSCSSASSAANTNGSQPTYEDLKPASIVPLGDDLGILRSLKPGRYVGLSPG